MSSPDPVLFFGTVLLAVVPPILLPMWFHPYFKRQCCPIPMIISIAVALPLTALLVGAFRWICGWFA